MHHLARLDHRYVWHPFTQMRDWLKREPLVLVSGKGAVLRDVHGREYLDANSSIWTNLHGHNHPVINRAITNQLRKVAHTSALGFANEPAALLAEQLIRTANPSTLRRTAPRLEKVFFSDDGATAVEVALKLAYEYARRSGRARRPRFLCLEGAYHGDTVGAVSLGHIELFHKTYSGLLFRTDTAPAPYCYRCRFNRATPERADAREYRKCNSECLSQLENQFQKRKAAGEGYAGFVFEPLIQGAAGMIAQPSGWLRRAAEVARGHGALLLADEVMTGFGRTGFKVQQRLSSVAAAFNPKASTSLYGSHHEGVQPDFLALAKGLTGGYLPMAATLTTQAVFDAFLGEYGEFKTFFHGHSYTANQVGAAAGLVSLGLLQTLDSRRSRARIQAALAAELQSLWTLPNTGDIRQVGLIAGVELVRDFRTRQPFELAQRVGIRVCDAMARRGVLTRPIGNVIVLMPPYCTTRRQLARMVGVLHESIRETLG